MRLERLRVLAIGILAIVTVACSSDGGSSGSTGTPPAATSLTGVFLDSPVQVSIIWNHGCKWAVQLQFRRFGRLRSLWSDHWNNCPGCANRDGALGFQRNEFD